MSNIILRNTYPVLSTLQDDLFGRLHSEFDEFFNAFFSPDRYKKVSTRTYPKVDIYRDNNDLVIKAGVAGLKRQDISIVLQDGTLTIEGRKVNKEENNKQGYITKELKGSSFSRSWTIPEDYPEPEAKLEDGILTLTFKDVVKEKQPQKKVIDIK